jgi:hypothetical protein
MLEPSCIVVVLGVEPRYRADRFRNMRRKVTFFFTPCFHTASDNRQSAGLGWHGNPIESLLYLFDLGFRHFLQIEQRIPGHLVDPNQLVEL